MVKRTQPVAMLKAFDAPVMEVNCDCRPSSTVAPQSLMLMNSDFILRHARKFADRLRSEATTPVEIDFDLASLPTARSVWQYGYGRLDEEAGRVIDFATLPHFNGNAWQGGAKLPDAQLGYLFLSASSGHPETERAVIRRWVAPYKGTLTIRGSVGHPSENGDGVRASVVSSRSGIAGQWVADHGSAETQVERIAVEAGDTIDLVIDCRTNHTSDTFSWETKLELQTESGDKLVVDTKTDFHGPLPDASLLPAQVARAWELAYSRPATSVELRAALEFLVRQVVYLQKEGTEEARKDPQLHALTNLCQVLLSSNEFLYVD